MRQKLLLLLAALSLAVYPQAWSTFLDPSRAIDWSKAGFTIPNYTVNCPTQPTLTPNDPGAAAANRTAIQNALASCDATHNVVNVPAGSYYVNGWSYGAKGKQVVRGAGPMSTIIYLTGSVSMASNPAYWSGNPVVLPPSGSNQCSWTAGYEQGTTTITLNNCPNGSGPPLNQTIFLDQANDAAPGTGGIYVCDTTTDDGVHCTNKGPGTGNVAGRTIGGVGRSQKQAVLVTAKTGSGTGPYAVTISPGIWFTNIRSSQNPGAFWPGYVQYDGLENLTLDSTGLTQSDAVSMQYCHNCWVKNIRSITGGTRDHIGTYLCANCMIRDSYFYQNQSHSSSGYAIDVESSSGLLIANNIFQQTTVPIMFGNGSGSVVGYNYSINNVYTVSSSFMQAPNMAHNAGNNMNLWEGNNMNGIWGDSVTWGSSTQNTMFRNMVLGWQMGKTQSTYPLSLNSWSRAYNAVGNVLGQPGYHSNYESYSTSATAGVNGGTNANRSIYVLGWTGISGVGGCSGPPVCDPLVRSTFMRWGNYDTVTAGVKWDPVEASPGAVSFVRSNFTSSYFSSLAHNLPPSLYYASRPSWWPSGAAWPPIGPDVTGGNLGMCSSGTYAGVQATGASQCAGGNLSPAWDGHAFAIPAQACYLNVMKGPPDGSGNVLSFDARSCVGTPDEGKLVAPSGLAATSR